MEDFVKVTNSKQKISGVQKAAILLGELGLEAGLDVLSFLRLTPEEQKKIRKTMKALGPYPRNINDILREEAVLNETLRFGKAKGIYEPVPKPTVQEQMLKDSQNGVSKMLKENPEALTNLIRAWLDK